MTYFLFFNKEKISDFLNNTFFMCVLKSKYFIIYFKGTINGDFL